MGALGTNVLKSRLDYRLFFFFRLFFKSIFLYLFNKRQEKA